MKAFEHRNNPINKPVSDYHVFRRQPSFLPVVSCLILAWAYFATFRIPYRRTEYGRLFEWFFTYEHGFVHRGLTGTVFQFVHGPATAEKIIAYLPIWETWIIAAIVFLFWILPLVAIFRGCWPNSTKWMLVACMSVFLFMPGWKQFSELAGFTDEWVLLFVLPAFACFLLRRPLAYALLVIPAFLFHPQAILYILLISMLIFHAVIRDPVYAVRWKVWLAAMLFPISVCTMLALLHSAETAYAFIDMHRQEILRYLPLENFMVLAKDFLTQGNNNMHVTHLMLSAFSGGAAFIYLENTIPLLVYAFVFSRWCCPAMGSRSSFSVSSHPLIRRMIPAECYIMTF
ncbi:MAG: hypothetical protein OXC81_02855, partial [Betaproteobacteria bacterium]|nr:hypothetical protein [Betaproteobacteria bacterium]